MSKERFEWRCRQSERVSQHMPKVLDKIKIMTQRMRTHIVDDPEGLNGKKNMRKMSSMDVDAASHSLLVSWNTSDDSG